MEEKIYEWPTDKGIWMGYFEEQNCWLPLLADELECDAPSIEQLRLEKENPENAPPRKKLLILTQYPVSEKWMFTFQSCHPITKWRRPGEEELIKAKIFHGITDTQK